MKTILQGKYKTGAAAGIALLACAQIGFSSERVVRMQQVNPNPQNRSGSLFHQVNIDWNLGNWNPSLANAMNKTFTVYTTEEVDNKLTDTNNRATDALNRIAPLEKRDQALDAKFSDLETKIKSEVTSSISNLPGSLLTAEATKAIKEAILAEVQTRLEAMKNELLHEIQKPNSGQ